MHFLLTNDDGVLAPGLLALAQSLRGLGKVTVLAPDRNWSASGHVKTLHRPLRVNEVKLADGSPALTSDGAPSDCVALALLGVVQDKIDLVVSGINPNANVGHDVTYSGTVTAAMEAIIWGVPGLAVSLDAAEHDRANLDFHDAAQVASCVIAQMISHPLARDMLLNINIPHLPLKEIRGVAVTRQGTRIYRDVLVPRSDPQGRSYYWFGGEAPTGITEEGTDIGSLADGCVSITPLHLDMTAYEKMEHLHKWNLSLSMSS